MNVNLYHKKLLNNINGISLSNNLYMEVCLSIRLCI